jgi:hypothetical protein
VADAENPHRHGPNKFPSTITSTTHVHNSTAYPHAYATSLQVCIAVAGSRSWPTRYIFAYHGHPRRALVDSVRLTHYLLDSLSKSETLVSYTKRRLQTWYVSLEYVALGKKSDTDIQPHRPSQGTFIHRQAIPQPTTHHLDPTRHEPTHPNTFTPTTINTLPPVSPSHPSASLPSTSSSSARASSGSSTRSPMTTRRLSSRRRQRRTTTRLSARSSSTPRATTAGATLELAAVTLSTTSSTTLPTARASATRSPSSAGCPMMLLNT